MQMTTLLNWNKIDFLDAEYRNALSEGVLRLQESGKLAALKTKWWKEKKGGGACLVILFNHIRYFIKKKVWCGI